MSILSLLISSAVSKGREKSILYSRVTLIILVGCLLICLYCFNLKLYDKGIGIFSGLYNATIISHAFHVFAFIVSVFIIQLNCFFPGKLINNNWGIFSTIFLTSEKYFMLNKTSQQYKIIEYPLILLFIILGGVFLISSADLISIFLSIELQSYGLYILCAIYRNSERATSGALTYFLLGGLSSCFILLGSSLLYSNSATTGFDGLYIINNISEVGNYSVENSFYKSDYFNFALSVMSIGFLFKVSAAPFHFWSPDVYDAIPTVVTTFVAVFAKITILILLLELIHFTGNIFVSNIEFENFSQYYSASWTFTILISSFLSLIIGSILGLNQSRIKRLYAYSTISHMGFILLAISINTIESTQSFMFYLMQYSLSNINAFLLLIAVGYILWLEKGDPNLFFINKNNSILKTGDLREKSSDYYNDDVSDRSNSPVQLITDIKGLFYINSYVAMSLAITLFSFVGIPPLVGFFAKQMVLTSAIDNGYIFMSIIAILASVISACYYLVVVKQIFFEKSENTNLPSIYKETEGTKIISNYLDKYGLSYDLPYNLDRFYSKNESSSNDALSTSINSDAIESPRAHTTFKIIYPSDNSNESVYLSSSLSVLISMLTLITLLFIFAPQEWLNYIYIISILFFRC